MMEVDSSLQNLKSQHPEWLPWLAVVEVVLGGTADPQWDAVVPLRRDIQRNDIPLLAQARLDLPESLVRPMLVEVMRMASQSGSPTMAKFSAVAVGGLDIITLFRAALHHDDKEWKRMAAVFCIDPGAFEAVGMLMPVPLLQACNRAWEKSLAPAWTEGYCPICGTWPAYAEVRGIERGRYFRCGRCGIGWQAQCLSCPYCGMTDHNELVSLVPENSLLNAVIDACKRCLGYVKTFTKLQGSAPTQVLLDDLASVELDVAAAEQGYKRPQGTGYFLNVTVTENCGASDRSA